LVIAAAGLRAWLRRLLWLCGPLCLVPAWAVNPALTLSQLHHQAWTVRDGAPADIWAMAQTSDGALWLGTPTGLFRFDGMRFERFAPPGTEAMPLGDIGALMATPEGGLWIGLRFGGAYLWQGSRLTSYGDAQGLPTDRSVFSFAREPDGRVWAGTTQGLYRFEAERWQAMSQALGHSGGWIFAVHRDRSGTLWLAGQDGTFRMPPGATSFIRVPAATADNGFLIEAPDGEVWTTDSQSPVTTLYKISAVARAPKAPLVGIRNRTPMGWAQFDRDGGLWVGVADDGMTIAREPSFARIDRLRHHWRPGAGNGFGTAQGMSGTYATAMFEDRDGNFWVGTNGGIDRFRAPKLVWRDEAHFIDMSLAPASDQSLWLGHWDLGLLRLDGEKLRSVNDKARDRQHLHVASDGTVWMGERQGLWDVGAAAKTPLPWPPAAAPVLAAQAVFKDRDGGLWASLVREGLFRLHDGVWTRNGGLSGLPEPYPLVMVGEPTGRMWLGYAKSRVAMVEAGQVRAFGPEQGLRIGNVQALYAAGNRLLAGGDDGIARWTPAGFVSLLGQGDEPFLGISAIVEGPDDALWLNGTAGISRLPFAELQHAERDPAHRMAFQRFDHLDGLLGVATQARPLPSATRDGKGRLWFSTGRGLFSIDPKTLTRNLRPPAVEIRALQTEGQRLAPVPGERLPPGTTRLSVDYTAISLSIPERVRFRVRLDGVDTDWQDAGTRREAFYTNLGPGDYRFRVIAANEDGVWNEEGASLAFTIAPAFHQTTWFHALVALACAAALWGLYRLRLQHVAARLRTRLEARAQERERIARELHDTLLQSTQGLILGFQALAERTPQGDPTRQRMEHLLQRADAALAEGRDRVHELRSTDLHGPDLLRALSLVAEELRERHPAVWRSAVEGEPRPLQPQARDAACGIGREALANAFTHASAAHIECVLRYGADALELRVSDDGCGIAVDVLQAGARPGHWGLTGMQERAAGAGGQLRIGPRRGGGTDVEFRLPAGRAYAVAPRARRKT
jgi:signal transduction histidine kinase/ligand-binding sensor domain-containing protein